MSIADEIIREMRVEPGQPVNVRGRDAAWLGEQYFTGLEDEELKRLWADDTYALVGGIVVDAIERLNVTYSQATAEQLAGLSAARER